MRNDLKITFDPKGLKFDKISMLQILNKFGANISYECLNGYCGTCKCKYPKEGFVTYFDGKSPLMEIEKDEDGNPKFFLPCISKIDRSKLIIDNQSGKATIVIENNSLENTNKKKKKQKP